MFGDHPCIGKALTFHSTFVAPHRFNRGANPAVLQVLTFISRQQFRIQHIPPVFQAPYLSALLYAIEEFLKRLSST